jgi:hypothetical protein
MRQFETDYAGAYRGYCTSRENAIVAAMKRVTFDGYKRCTITDLITRRVVATVHLDPDCCRAVITTVKPLKYVVRK